MDGLTEAQIGKFAGVVRHDTARLVRSQKWR
jgi:hypothetical protein